MNNYTVYMHISPNSKRYIGITCQKPEYRWSNGKGYKNNQHFTRAIEKYGWDNFEHIIIVKGLSEDEAKWLEIELIREFDSTNQKKGYNITIGGDGVRGINPFEMVDKEKGKEWRRKISEALKGKKRPEFSLKIKGENNYWYGKCLSEAHKQKISEAKKGKCFGENHPMYGKKRSEETKRKISENHADMSGENNPMYEKKHSEESKKKMSEARKGKYYGKNSTHKKTIICLTTRKIFYTIKKGAEHYNIKNKSSISACCKGKLKSCGKLSDGTKLVWRYIEIIEL